MTANDPSREPSQPRRLPRRTLVASAAWTTPVVVAAAAAPAYAASVCSTSFTYKADWGSAESQFSRTSATGASVTATAAAGGQPMRVGFASSYINNAANGYTLDPTHNLTVPGPSAGGTTPNVTNLGAIVPGGSERGLCLQHSTSTTATTNLLTGQPDRGQRLTISFPRMVTGLSFWLVDIDSTSTGYWDRVRFGTAPTTVQSDPNVVGMGVGTSPFTYGILQSNNNIDENAAGARTKVTFAGALTSLVMEYWNASFLSGSSIQRLFLGDLQFTAKGC